MTPDSPTGYRHTLAEIPGTAAFSDISQTSIRANWTANVNPAGTEYYCENETAGTNSSWTTETTWESTGLGPDTSYCFRVRARNGDGVETDWTSLGCAATLVGGDCGNGTVDAGEQCDDGNTQNGDCCSSTCQFEPLGSSCSNGLFCDGEETCDGAGACVDGPDPCDPVAEFCHEESDTCDACIEIGELFQYIECWYRGDCPLDMLFRAIEMWFRGC